MSKKILLNENFSFLKEQLETIEEQFQNSDQMIHNARNQLKIIELEGKRYVVKSFKRPNLLNKIIYTFFKASKAKKSYDNALKLLKMGVQTPTPVASIENYKLALLDTSFFISKHFDYDFTIREVFHHKVENTDEILKQFTNFTYDLHQKGVWHVDYSLGNILIQKEKSGYIFSLVDINRMEFKSITPKEGLKNFNKFWAKDQKDLEIIAKEYARLSGFDEKEAIKIVKEEAQKIIDFKTKKKKLKQMVGKV